VASRVEPFDIARQPRQPRLPRLGAAVRLALTDYYFNSIRLVAANVVWGTAAAAVALSWLVWPLAGLVLTPLLAMPTVGVFRLAALIVRDGHASFRDTLAGIRDYAGPALLLGVASVAAGLVLGTNAVVGLTQSEPVGWFIGTFAAWGLVVLFCGAIVAWPLVVDPHRATDSLGRRIRLAGLLLLAHPGRFAALGIVVALLAAVSAVLLAALLTISVSFIALVACRYVYPTADRFEARHDPPS
jgi:uncharacterized membrane protein YesL